MTPGPFSPDVMMRALRGVTVASVDVLEMFPASSAEVARLRVTSSDGHEPFTAIGKSATGAGLAAARQELRFFEHLAPRWDSSAPRLLGACEDDRGADARILLLIEDLDRPARDLALLRRYWDGLRAAGIEAYDWDLCQWDYQFSLLTNLFQSVFQHSLPWFRTTAAVITALGCRAALRRPPPLHRPPPPR